MSIFHLDVHIRHEVLIEPVIGEPEVVKWCSEEMESTRRAQRLQAQEILCVCVCVCVCVCIRTEVHGLCNIHYACIFVYTALAKKIADGMKKSLIFDLHIPV